MAQLTINYTATADLKSFSTWLTNNVDQNASTWDSGTGEGVLVLNEGVTEIGSDAFQNCTTITKVNIGEGITSIQRNQAFAACTGLTSITFPNSLTSIGNQAFAACTGLTSITFPNSLTSIGGEAFRNCTSLISVTFGNSLTTIDVGAFRNCTNLTTFTIPSSVTLLYINSFENTSWWNSQSNGVIYKDGWCFGYKTTSPIGDLTINADKIAENAFRFVTGITSITFPNSVTIIGGAAFQGCTGLTSITLPISLTKIGTFAFFNCTSLTTIYWNAENITSYAGTSVFQSCPVSTLVFGDSVQSIPNYALQNCTSITNITIPNSVTNIGSYAFNGCTNLLSVTSLSTTPPTLGNNSFNASNDTLKVLPSALSAYQNNSSWSSKFTTIEALPVINYTANSDLKAFSTWCTTNVNQSASTWDSTTHEGVLVLNSGVTAIGANAFDGCTTITKVTIGEGITNIGGSAFLGCSNLTYAELPSTLTNLGHQTFWNNSKLNIVYCKALVPPTISTTSNFSSSSDGLFVIPSAVNDYKNSDWNNLFSGIYPYNGTSVITYHSSADLSNYSTWITQNAISTTYDSTTQVGTIELFPYEIGKEAFKNCSTLTEVSFTNIIKLGDSCFYYCTGLTSITFPNSLTTIGKNAFYSCSNLTSVIFGNSVTTIDGNAFQTCTSLTSFTIPASVISIGYQAFHNTGWWNSQSDGIIYKDNWSFGYKGSKPTGSLTIIDNTKGICNQAFQSCTGLTSITFPNSLTTIGNMSFSGCSSLTEITLPESVTTIGNQAFENCSGLTSVTFGDSVTTIGNQAFRNCSSLTEITLPDSLITINNAFLNCTGLTSVTFGDSITTIGDSTFSGCSSLTEITLPESVTTIGNSAFNGCTSLTTIYWNAINVTSYPGYSSVFRNNIPIDIVIFGNSVTNIPTSAFNGCSTLTSVTFGDSVTSIGQQAFNGCSSLTEITLPESVTTVAFWCFSSCTSLTTIYWNAINITSYPGYSSVFGNNIPIDTVIFGDSVTNIPNNAFSNCSTLTEITLPESLMTIGNSAFNGCSSLTEITLPESLTTIGEYAFGSCIGLTEITLSESITTINNNAFSGCTSLTTIYWNAINVTLYGGYNNVFGNNIPIDTVIFGHSVTNIPNNAFSNCSSLTSFTLGNSLTTIGRNAFGSCTGLTSVTLGKSLTTIGQEAFYRCSNLTSVIFGDSVTTIGQSAFRDCTNLLSVTSLATTPPTLDSYNFIVSEDTLYMPIASKSAYQSDNEWRTAFTYYKGLCEISTSTDGNGTITPTELVVEGESFTVTATPNAHYKVSHFVVDGVDVGTIDNYTFQNLDANHIIHVDFELITHTITATASIGGSISPSGSITVNDGSDQTFTITPNAHYYISDVTVDGTSVGAVSTYTFTNVSTVHTINATFTQYTHTITATAFEGGAIVPSGAITVNEGENQSFDIVPLEGYGILAVFIDGTQIEPVETYTFTDVEEDHTIQAMFYSLQTAGFNRDEMLDIDYIIQDYLEQMRKRD